MDFTEGGGGGGGDKEEKKGKEESEVASCSKEQLKPPDPQCCDNERDDDLVEEEEEDSDEVEMKSASETVEGQSEEGGDSGDIIDLRPDTAPDLTDTDTDEESFSDAQEEADSSVIFKRRKLSNSRVYRRGSNNNQEEEEEGEEAEPSHSGAAGGGSGVRAQEAADDEDEDIPELEDTVLDLDADSSHSGGLTSPESEEGDVDIASLARDICSKTPSPPRTNLLRDLYRSELGQQLRPSLHSRVCGSLETVRRLHMVNKLSGHEGCVNSVSFNSSGDRIASGSDDLHIILWDWQRNRSLLRFNTGHRANVFQSKILPGDLLLTSCSRDGQVRLAELSVTGALRSTKRLAQHKVNTVIHHCTADIKDITVGPVSS